MSKNNVIKKYKCPICLESDIKDRMVQESNRRYYHSEKCHSEYLLNKEIENKKVKLKKFKCKICSVTDVEDVLIKEADGRFYHVNECHKAYLAKRKETDEEQEYKMKLALLLAKLYNLESYKFIPNYYWIRVEKLRNEYTEANELGRTYKSGLPFKALYMTYDYCFNIAKITYDVLFDSFKGQLNYDLAIVQNNLVEARNYYAEKSRQERKVEKVVQQQSSQHAVDLSKLKQALNYKRKKDERDISRFLD